MSIVLDKQQMILQTADNLLKSGDLEPGESVHRFYQAMAGLTLDQVAVGLLNSSRAYNAALLARATEGRN